MVQYNLEDVLRKPPLICLTAASKAQNCCITTFSIACSFLRNFLSDVAGIIARCQERGDTTKGLLTSVEDSCSMRGGSQGLSFQTSLSFTYFILRNHSRVTVKTSWSCYWIISVRVGWILQISGGTKILSSVQAVNLVNLLKAAYKGDIFCHVRTNLCWQNSDGLKTRIYMAVQNPRIIKIRKYL